MTEQELRKKLELLRTEHRDLDAAREAQAGAASIGTTKRGIGPAYEDKVARRGLRVGDLFHRERFAAKLGELLDYHNFQLVNYYKEPAIDFQQTLEDALSDATLVIAASARPRGCRWTSRRPRRISRRSGWPSIR